MPCRVAGSVVVSSKSRSISWARVTGPLPPYSRTAPACGSGCQVEGSVGGADPHRPADDNLGQVAAGGKPLSGDSADSAAGPPAPGRRIEEPCPVTSESKIANAAGYWSRSSRREAYSTPCAVPGPDRPGIVPWLEDSNDAPRIECVG